MFTKTHLVLAAATWIALASSWTTLARQTFHGTVVSTTGGQLTIMSGGDTVRFIVDAQTEVTVDRQEAELTDLTPDHEAIVTSKSRGDAWYALKIEARTQKAIVQRPSNKPVAVDETSDDASVRQTVFKGRITAMKGGDLTLVDMDGDRHTFTTSKTTIVTIDGDDADLADLQVGFSADVAAQRNGVGLTAHAVHATTQH